MSKSGAIDATINSGRTGIALAVLLLLRAGLLVACQLPAKRTEGDDSGEEKRRNPGSDIVKIGVRVSVKSEEK